MSRFWTKQVDKSKASARCIKSTQRKEEPTEERTNKYRGHKQTYNINHNKERKEESTTERT
eukprot:732101-Heterocapsa_arctica.AAC.1